MARSIHLVFSRARSTEYALLDHGTLKARFRATASDTLPGFWHIRRTVGEHVGMSYYSGSREGVQAELYRRAHSYQEITHGDR